MTNTDIIKINILETASFFSEVDLIKIAKGENPTATDEEIQDIIWTKDGETFVYTDKFQDYFNDFYDFYYSILNDLKIK